MNFKSKKIDYSLALILTASIFMTTDGRTQEMDHSTMEEHGSSPSEKKPLMETPVNGEVVKPIDDMAVMRGEMIYKMSCFLCHGKNGEGDGPASRFIGPYSHPRPNRFTSGVFKFRSTESGELPMLKDLMRTIREGIPGYMPSFRNLGEDGIHAVASYIAKAFIREELPTSTTIKYVKHVGPYTYSAKSAWRGGILYNIMKCNECHGADGKGGRTDLKDERKILIHPVDLTRQETFGNGTRHEDIYRTIMTGLDGTPMPGYNDAFRGEEDSAWDLVHFILSLQGR